jgi:putative thiamine transport system permease protein
VLTRPFWLIPAALFGVPLAAAVVFGIVPALDAAAWSRLFADSQFFPALALSAWTGVASTALVTAVTLHIVTRAHATRAWGWLQASLGPMLAVPHAAFAIGLALLLMPSGGIARFLAFFTGWTQPPDIATVQDPWGLSLIVGLVLKEVPFLLWNVAAQLHRAGQDDELTRQLQLAATMGYSRRSAWARVLWPQLLPRLALPLLAVWAYSLSVVDMALVIGPTRPPTLAVLAWQWLLDADTLMNSQGAAAALLLALCVLAGAAAAAWLGRVLRPRWLRRWTRGDRSGSDSGTDDEALPLALVWLVWFYAAVLVMLVFASLAGLWRFPRLLPTVWSLLPWRIALEAGATLFTTVALALASAATGLLLAVAWMETTTPRWDARAAPVVFAPMLVPGVLLASGLYRLTLDLGIDAQFSGLWLAHSLVVAPYVLVVLAPAYRGIDPRYAQTTSALGRSRAHFLWRVKWPMLLAPLAAAFAVGFAVSVTQYLSTQFVGAGRYATVTTEALALASGGQRSLGAAFALLQGLLPCGMFAAAWWLGRRHLRRVGESA